ncbi:MAG: response regulator [Deltaproteobacteria bacterium]|nr:response regulator [Deltaproteobacteria bacterium]
MATPADEAADTFHIAAVATVFVVDDNGGVRKSLRALLESTGLAVETYASGEEFLAGYNPEHAGCMVLDVRLRHGSGLDLQDELRRRKAILPIIVLTGYGDKQTSTRALKAGAFDFLQKPAPPAVLLQRIGAAIDFDHQARMATTDRAIVSGLPAPHRPRGRATTELPIAAKPSKEVAAVLHTGRTVKSHHRRGRLSRVPAKPAPTGC